MVSEFGLSCLQHSCASRSKLNKFNLANILATEPACLNWDYNYIRHFYEEIAFANEVSTQHSYFKESKCAFEAIVCNAIQHLQVVASRSA